MNTKNLLDQLLRSGSQILNEKGQSIKNPQNYNTHNSENNVTDNLSALVSGKGGAALAGGALGLLIGSKSGRKIGGKVLTYGGLAALGALAYKAYQNYQQQSRNPDNEPIQPFELLSTKESEAHCKVVLIALIAAAKADGHIDDKERKLIDNEVAKLTEDPELQKWFEAELKKSLDPAEVARHSKNTTMATQMYLASLLAVDQQNFMEKSYLDELARQLQLPSDLQMQIKEQVKQAETIP